MLILTRRTAPFASFTTFSSAGPSCLHGPHHGAQKSTMTGTCLDASSTSAAKLSIEPSLMNAPGEAGPGAVFGALPVSGLPLGPINAIQKLSQAREAKMGTMGWKEKSQSAPGCLFDG